MEDNFAGKEDTKHNATEVEMLAEVNRCTTNTVDIPHSVDTGHQGPDHTTSELHSGEVDETRDHSTPGTITPST